MTDQLSARERDGAGDGTAPTPDDTDRVDPPDRPSGEPGSAPPRAARRERQRVSRWDRPPEPHDWRFFVGTLGRILIATGLLMFGFVAYQLWGTGIETARAQNRLENEFEQLVAEDQATRDEPVPVSTAPSDPDGTPSVDSAPEPRSDGGDGGDGASTGTPDEPTTDLVVGDIVSGDIDTLAPVDLSDDAIDQDIPPFGRGDPLALLEIPAIGRSDIVVPGVSLDDLKNGPGHYPDTPLPGQLGNAAIAGHRTTYGAPFFDVDQLERGDEIIVTMVTGDRFVYEVTSLEVVSAADYWVVTTSDPNIAELTLTSCHPKYTARDRIVVHSLLNPETSSRVGVATFYDLDDDNVDDGDDEDDGDGDRGDDPIPGDDPVIAEPSADSDGPETSDDTAEATDPPPADDDAEEPQPAPVARDDAATPPDVGDAFDKGWFEDRAAWPQIALWAAALTLISVIAYRISRRFRRYSIGFVVGVVPFVVALYFFYQNVNRLLPPGI